MGTIGKKIRNSENVLEFYFFILHLQTLTDLLDGIFFRVAWKNSSMEFQGFLVRILKIIKKSFSVYRDELYEIFIRYKRIFKVKSQDKISTCTVSHKMSRNKFFTLFIMLYVPLYVYFLLRREKN